MKKDSTVSSNDFEFAIFELISENRGINSPYFNHQLNKLYIKYKPMAAKLTRQYHLDSELAEDVLQEGIVLLINRIQEGRFEFNSEYKFKSFLFRTFQNLSANINKRYKKNMEAAFWCRSEEAYDDESYDFESYAETIDENRLEDLIGQLIHENLSPQGARVLEVCLLQKKSNEEGAVLMNYKDESIFRKKKSQHLATLRKAITPDEKGELMRMAS